MNNNGVVVWVFQMAIFQGSWILQEHIIPNSRWHQAPMKQKYDHKPLEYLNVYTSGMLWICQLIIIYEFKSDSWVVKFRLGFEP